MPSKTLQIIFDIQKIGNKSADGNQTKMSPFQSNKNSISCQNNHKTIEIFMKMVIWKHISSEKLKIKTVKEPWIKIE